MKSLLLVTHNQFGYQLNSYYYSYYLRNRYKVSYISFDEGKEKYQLDDVKVYYIEKKKTNKIISYFRLVLYVAKMIIQKKPDIVIIKYFPTCCFAPILTFRKIFLDLRTASVYENNIKNKFNDWALKFESNFFYKILILSASLRSRLNLSRAHVVPLGAEPKGYSVKLFDTLRLLYIGTLSGRDIDKTIKGLKLFKDIHPEIDINYAIIGDGDKVSKDKIYEYITMYNLQDIVSLKGYVLHTRIEEYLLNCNVGVSFVPQTKYYDKQPPTKTYEYLFSGMPVIATNTYENALIINNKNGILIEDTPESFCEGIINIWKKKDSWLSNEISESVSDFTWESIIENKLLKNIVA